METPLTSSRYFFHVRGPGIEFLDPEGSEHAGLAAVKLVMLTGALDMLAQDLKGGRALDLRCRIDAEADCVIVASLAFNDAFLTLY